MRPGITVVIPTIEGREDSLMRAMASVAGQSMPAKGLVVERDIHRTGAAATRNRAIERVDTEFVAFCDDDDELLPDHLKLCARFARLGGVDVVYPGYEPVGGSDPVGCFGLPFDGSLLLRRNFIPVTTLCRTEAVLAAGGFQVRPDEHGAPCEDWGLWLAMQANGARFGHLAVKTWRWWLGDGTTKGRGLDG